MKPGRRPFTETYTCGLGPTHPQPMHRSSWDRVHTRTLGAQSSLSGVLLQIVQQTEIERSVPHFCISSSGESISKQHRCSLYRQMVPSNIVPTPSDTIDMRPVHVLNITGTRGQASPRRMRRRPIPCLRPFLPI